MLPDYPELKRRIKARIVQRLRRVQQRTGGPLAQMRPVRMAEGSRAILVREDGSVDTMSPVTIEAKTSISTKELSSLDPATVLAKLDEMAKEMETKKQKLFYAKLDRAANAVGNVVNAKGGITADAIIEMVERMQIDFDTAGNPELPTIHAGPAAAEKLEAALRQLETDAGLRRAVPHRSGPQAGGLACSRG